MIDGRSDPEGRVSRAPGLVPVGRQHVRNCGGGLIPRFLLSVTVTRELPLFQKRQQMESGI